MFAFFIAVDINKLVFDPVIFQEALCSAAISTPFGTIEPVRIEIQSCLSLRKSIRWQVGTIGFGYPDWRGAFYPPGVKPQGFLTYYSRVFNCVEIDTTFYGVPRLDVINRWAAETPPGFMLYPKTEKSISHEMGLVGVDGVMRKFVERVQLLGEKLGPLLIQLPPSFGMERRDVLQRFLIGLSSDVRYAIEVRSQSWYTAGVESREVKLFLLLNDLGIAWVTIDYPGLPLMINSRADFLYVRWIGEHGHVKKHDHESIDCTERLGEWQMQIASGMDGVNIVFGNLLTTIMRVSRLERHQNIASLSACLIEDWKNPNKAHCSEDKNLNEPMTNTRFAKYAWIVLIANLFVILWGAYVRATGSGAGCGNHWPLCNGEIVPRAAQIETTIEFSHRLSSGAVLLLVIALVFWAYRQYPKGHPVRLGATLSTVLIVTEALVGAGLVLFEWVAKDASIGRVISISVHLINTFLLLAALSLTAWWASGGEALFFKNRGAVTWAFGVGFAGIMLIGVTGAITALGDTLFPAGSLAEGIRQDFAATAHFLVRLRVRHPVIAIGVGFYLLFLSGVVGMSAETSRRTTFCFPADRAGPGSVAGRFDKYLIIGACVDADYPSTVGRPGMDFLRSPFGKCVCQERHRGECDSTKY